MIRSSVITPNLPAMIVVKWHFPRDRDADRSDSAASTQGTRTTGSQVHKSAVTVQTETGKQLYLERLSLRLRALMVQDSGPPGERAAVRKHRKLANAAHCQ